MSESGGFHPGYNPWVVALTVTLATFMEVLDTSIANVALPHIAGNLSAGQDQSTWVITSYLVSNAIVLPLSGWLSTRFGRKRFYMACVALFTGSSLLCGFAPSLGMLIFFRVLQGIGGGGLGPSAQSILADTFPAKKLGPAFAVYGMAVVLAPAIGPTLGGFITDHYSWRWVFFINVPVGFLSLLLTRRMLQDPPYLARARRRLGRIDLTGIALIAVGLGSLEVVLDKGQEDNWFTSRFITAFAVVAVTALVAFVAWELKRENPVVDLRMFKHRSFTMAMLMMGVLGATLFGTTLLLPQFTQTQLGYTAQLAGEALSPGGLVIMLMMPLVGVLITRVDARKLIAFGFLAAAVGLYYMGQSLSTTISFGTATELRVFQAFGIAFLFVPINTVSYVGVPREKNNEVSGMINLARNVGGDIGIATFTALVAHRSQIHQTNLASHTSRYNPTFVAQLDAITSALVHTGATAQQANRKAVGMLGRALLAQATTLAYVDVIRVFAALCVLMVPLVFFMKKNDPRAAAAAAA
jgi:DHA2 family multidrug resistance protein